FPSMIPQAASGDAFKIAGASLVLRLREPPFAEAHWDVPWGIAPSRAFLHEREALGATGKNWLLFGDQQAAFDFLYEEELIDLTPGGVLTRKDTASSRDGDRKTYVPHRLGRTQQGCVKFRALKHGTNRLGCFRSAEPDDHIPVAIGPIKIPPQTDWTTH